MTRGIAAGTAGDESEQAVQLGAWLSERLGAEVRLDGVRAPAQGGLSSDTLLATARWRDHEAGEQSLDLVFRLEPAAGLFPDYDLPGEAQLMKTLAEHTSVPVPTVRWVESRAEVVGRPFVVMDRVEGRIPSDFPPYHAGGWLLDASPLEQRRLQRSSIEAMAAVCRLDPWAMGLGFLDRREYGPAGPDQQLGYWRAVFAWACGGDAVTEVEEVFAWCERNRPGDDPPVGLCWGDARLANIVYGPGFEPAALLDWEMATVGPGELDLAWFLFLHELALTYFDELPGFAGRDQVIADFAAALGREVRDLLFYEVLAGLRAAIVQVSIGRRRHDSGDPEGLRFQHANPVLDRVREMLVDPG
ncbi:MAG: putative aminoglycoside phosphotransferase [Acidimicrobiales bacterium]|nr:putative aminoglycoside phosphotransferase [Acidimicrobiales bacterium]